MTTQTLTTLAKSYRPAEFEQEILARWESSGVFHAEPAPPPPPTRPPYCIVIPPPNVTAALHLGHAFNNSLQDVLIRYHRMRGFNTLWMPGTDHAGIATQAVVEKRLIQQGKKRTDYSREEFVALVQEWKDEYEATITQQLKSLGCSCDWDRQRFTMDEMCAKAVREAFFRLFKEGLIYRGKRLVNWDPVSLTALADDEVEMKEVDGHFWYLRYPLVHPSTNPDDPLDCQEVTWSELAARGYPGAKNRPDEEIAWVTVATTRPETYLGDTAVAVNPKDPRAKALEGLCAQLPLVGRVIPIIQDDYVVLPDPDSSDPKARYATGFLKVTPAHDPNDYEIGQRHGESIANNSSGEVIVNVLAPDATISDQHGWNDIGDAHLFVGKSREDARELVVREFEARGLLEATKPYRHSVGHSYRSHVPIEPYLSDQWYVKVTDDSLVGEAQRALADEQFDGEKPTRLAGGAPAATTGDSELSFFPPRYAKMYQSWHDNLRDWCISRQLWWGHRIPVWSYSLKIPPSEEPPTDSEIHRQSAIDVEDYPINECAMQTLFDPKSGLYTWYFCPPPERPDIEAALNKAGNIQDPDVLDTWFSSGLWPLSTMGWPEPDSYPDTVGLLDTFNPTSVLCTGRDIITLWVSRMVMFNRYFNKGKVPFRHVYINPMIQDGHGQRMSKSLGNGVDPRDIIHSHGADALRFTLVDMATTTQDVRLPVDMVCPHCEESFTPKQITSPAGYTVAAPKQQCPTCGGSMVSGYGAASGEATPTDSQPLARNTSNKFDYGRNFCNKLWNAVRFAVSNLEEGPSPLTPLPVGEGNQALVDRWIITRLHRTLHTVEDAIRDYQFAVYADAMYTFVWGEFCDWYLEAIKPTVNSNPAQQQVLRTVTDAILRMLHPIVPFITEQLWPAVRETGESGIEGIRLPAMQEAATGETPAMADLRPLPPIDSAGGTPALPEGVLLAGAPWPDVKCSVDDKEADAAFARVKELVESIRRIRAERDVPPKRQIVLHATEPVMELIGEAGGVVETLAGLRSVELLAGDRPTAPTPLMFELSELLLTDLVDAVDASKERARLEKVIADAEQAISGFKGRLSNENYVSRAPAHVVQETRDQLAAAESELETARRALASLGGG